MSIPLDRLYHFLKDIVNDNIIIYRFWPHGLKKLENLLPLCEYSLNKQMFAHTIIYNDQEPLDFALFGTVSDPSIPLISDDHIKESITRNIKLISEFSIGNLTCPDLYLAPNEKIICHSEQRSTQLELYKKYGFIDAYYWSHAIIAQDWFRYAKHDGILLQKRKERYDFLIYNRAWQGTREYRLRFAEMLLEHNIKEYCNIRFAPIDDNVHYLDHVYRNQKWTIHTNLESYYDLNTFNSTASADYTSLDYITSNIEVVLETLFDDDRLHLTEKILRPIACRQPFMLMATHGSLEYLRHYGFETFSYLLDESYDTIVDPGARMAAVIAEMKRITQLPPIEKIELFSKLNIIAARNQERFFSDDFFKQVTQEYKTNMSQAIAVCEQEQHPLWLAEVNKVLGKS